MKSKVYPIILFGATAPLAWAADNPPPPQPKEPLADKFSLPEKNFDVSPKDIPTETATQNATHIPDINEHTLLQNPELLYRAMTSSVVLNNLAALREIVPIYKKLPENSKYYDAELLTLAQAKLDAANGKNAQAAAAFNKVLAKYPDMPTVRLDLALNQFYARHDKEAEKQLLALQQNEKLPENIRKSIQPYLNALKSRKKWQFYSSANFVRDTNINNSPKIDRVQIGAYYWSPPKAKRAYGIAYRAGASKDSNFYKNLFWRNELDINGKFYWNAHDYDEITARASTGIAKISQKHTLAFMPYYEKLWYAGQPYSHEIGARFEQQSWLNRKNRLSTAMEIGNEKFRNRNLLRDGARSNISLTWQKFTQKGQMFSVGYDFSHKNAKDKSDAYRRHGVRVAWSARWQNGLEHNISASAAKRSYRAPDFFNMMRQDKEYNAQLALGHRKVQFKGFQPKLVVQWSKRNSNNALFNYKKTNAFVQVQKSF